MTFTIILATNIVLDVALLGLLAFVMSRPAKLTPHRPAIATSEWWTEHLRHRERAGEPLAVGLPDERAAA